MAISSAENVASSIATTSPRSRVFDLDEGLPVKVYFEGLGTAPDADRARQLLKKMSSQGRLEHFAQHSSNTVWASAKARLA